MSEARNCGEYGIILQRMMSRLLANQTLCKLLYYKDKDPLSQPDISDTTKLMHNQIRIIPKYTDVETDQSVVILSIDRGLVDSSNSEVEQLLIEARIDVPINNWIIKNENLRPFLIIGEIEKSLANKKINGLGTIQVGDFTLDLITEQMTSYRLNLYVTTFK